MLLSEQVMAESTLPSIVVHPGLPKCATSALQRSFVIDNHSLASDLNVKILGKRFIPMNGYPPVSEIMYDLDQCLSDLEQQRYSLANYFFSSEALVNSPLLFKRIAQKFQILKVVFTCRFPPLQALSNYRYSGWIDHSLGSLELSQHSSLNGSISRHLNIFNRFADMYSIKLCPVEGGELLSRFCQNCFDQAPPVTKQVAFDEHSKHNPLNKSIGLGFASALASEISSRGLKITGKQRSGIVKYAQKWPLPNNIQNLMPHYSCAGLIEAQLDSLGSYESLLLSYGVDPAHVSLAIRQVEAELRVLLSQPIASKEELASFEENAHNLVTSFLKMES